MRSIFAAYYKQDETELNEFWKEALVVLDANVLLNLYRYPIPARDDLLTLLNHVSDRLAVPYQAALEYQRNRLTVISSQKGRFEEVRKVLADVEQQLTSELTKLQLQKRHSSISPDKLIDEVRVALNNFRDELSNHESSQSDVFDEDPIRKLLDKLLDGRIGPTPNQKTLDAIYVEGKARYEDGRPPGYKDEHKNKSERPTYYSNGLKIERAFGDLILWKQIIELAQVRNANSLILITDDEKEDWWWVVESKGKKTIGPRPELSEEIKNEAGVANFYIYNSERFMQSAKRYLGVEVSQTSIDEIGEIREETAEQGRISFGLLVKDAVHRWLPIAFKSRTIQLTNDFPDFLLVAQEGSSVVGCEVMIVSKRKIQNLEPSLFSRHKSLLDISAMVFVLVARSASSVEEIKQALELRLPEIPSDVILIIGYLDFTSDRTKPTFHGRETLEGTLT